MVTRASQRTLEGGQQAPAEPQTALTKRERDETPEAQDSWSDAVAAKRQAEEAETQPTQPPDEARAPASPPDPKTGRNRDGETDRRKKKAIVARRKHKYATLRELAAAVAAQYAVVAALFDAECLPDDAFACVASFWLGPRGYDVSAPARPRLAMPSIELA